MKVLCLRTWRKTWGFDRVGTSLRPSLREEINPPLLGLPLVTSDINDIEINTYNALHAKVWEKSMTVRKCSKNIAWFKFSYTTFSFLRFGDPLLDWLPFGLKTWNFHDIFYVDTAVWLYREPSALGVGSGKRLEYKIWKACPTTSPLLGLQAGNKNSLLWRSVNWSSLFKLTLMWSYSFKMSLSNGNIWLWNPSPLKVEIPTENFADVTLAINDN